MTRAPAISRSRSTILRPFLWGAIIAAILAASGCTSPSTPPPIKEDEEFQKITRGTVDLKLGVLPPALEKQDLEGDDVAPILYKPEALRERLVEELQVAGPFSGGVVPMGEGQVEDCLRSEFDPGLLPADLYLRIRLKEYQVRYDGHNAAFIPNLLFFVWNPLTFWPISFAIADESFEAKVSAEVHLTSLYSNGIVMRKVYEDLIYRAALNEYRDSTWESVSEEVADQVWRKLTLAMLQDLHTEFIAKTQAGSLDEALGTIRRRELWQARKRTSEEAVHYSYILGVGEFLRPDITALEYVENDAKAIRDHVKSMRVGGRNPDDYIGRAAGSAASTDYDSGALGTLRDITERVTERDTLFIYIAGKGAVIKTEAGTSSYVLLYDTHLGQDRIAQTSLPLDVLRQLLDQAKARVLVLVMDLRDIEYRERTEIGEGGGGAEGPPTDFYARLFPGGKGRILLASASPGQRAYESRTVGLGAFAHYLLEGAAGPADADGDGEVSVREAHDYLTPRLGKFARLNGGVQEPIIMGEEAGRLPLFP